MMTGRVVVNLATTPIPPELDPYFANFSLLISCNGENVVHVCTANRLGWYNAKHLVQFAYNRLAWYNAKHFGQAGVSPLHGYGE